MFMFRLTGKLFVNELSSLTYGPKFYSSDTCLLLFFFECMVIVMDK